MVYKCSRAEIKVLSTGRFQNRFYSPENVNVKLKKTTSLGFWVIAVCIKEGSAVVSGGQVSKTLSYKDHILELTYEEGSPCAANPSLNHSTIIHFICRCVRLQLLAFLHSLNSF